MRVERVLTLFVKFSVEITQVTFAVSHSSGANRRDFIWIKCQAAVHNVNSLT